jgi:phage-related protein
VTLDDYIDGGPDSRGILDQLLDLTGWCRSWAITNRRSLPPRSYAPKMTVALEKVASKCPSWHSMSNGETPKPLFWVGPSKKDLKVFPDSVQDSFGFALWLAQTGLKPLDAKPLKGFKGASVLEVVEDYRGNTYRAVYTVRFAKAVYMLHAFQKKAKKGIKTPKQEMERIEQRLKLAEQHYEEWSKEQERERSPNGS